MTLSEQKRALRAEMRARRQTVSPETRAAHSAAVCRELLKRRLPAPVAVYLATPSEIDLDDYIAACLARGIALVAPRWNGKTYDLARLTGLGADALRAGPMDVREPCAEDLVAPQTVGAWIVPGLAFTRDGRRLGYGGGWYDRLLAAARPDAPKISVAYPFQIVDALPGEHHDIPLTDILAPAVAFRE